MKKIIFPGWAVPLNLYSHLKSDFILDFGFFKNQNTNLSVIPCSLDSIDTESLKNLLPNEELHIIAHSLGALPALSIASELLNIKKLTIIAGFAKFSQSDDYPYGKPVAGINMMQGMLGLAAGMVLSRFYNEMTKPSDFNIEELAKPNSKELKKGLELLKTEDFRCLLSKINIPVSIIHGKADAIVDFRIAENLHNSLSNSTLKLIDNTGHALPFTHYDEYKSEI
jgi:pimeloyl-ACP methyl ester carboxylesterase